VKIPGRQPTRRTSGLHNGEDGQRGAVTVEFAFALMFLFLIFTAYIKVSEVFLAYERLRYATFAAARAQCVGGSASRAAQQIDKGYTLKTSSSGNAEKVSMTKKIELPEAIGKLWGEKDGFTIGHEVKVYKEPTQKGDNTAQ